MSIDCRSTPHYCGLKLRAEMTVPNPFLNLSYVALFALWAASYFVAIPVPINLIAQATLIVYIGSYRSLTLLIKEADGGAKVSICHHHHTTINQPRYACALLFIYDKTRNFPPNGRLRHRRLFGTARGHGWNSADHVPPTGRFHFFDQVHGC